MNLYSDKSWTHSLLTALLLLLVFPVFSFLHLSDSSKTIVEKTSIRLFLLVILLGVSMVCFAENGKNTLPKEYDIAKEKLKNDPKEALEFIDNILLTEEAAASKSYQAKLQRLRFTAFYELSDLKNLKDAGEKAIDLFTADGDYLNVINTKFYLSINIYNGGAEKEGLELLNEAYDLSVSIPDTPHQILILNQIGYFNFTKGNFDSGLENTLKALSILNTSDCCLNQKISNFNILGLIYSNIGEPETSLEYFQKALALIEESGITNQESNVNYNIGSVYLEKKDYAKSEIYFKKAYEKVKTNKEFHPEVFCMGLGDLYVSSGEFSKAKLYLEKAIVGFGKRKEYGPKGYSEGLLGIAELGLENSQKALRLFKKADQTISLSDHEVNKKEIYLRIAEACLKAGFYKEAYFNSNRLREIEHGIFKKEKQEKLLQLQIELETKEKEHEITQLTKEKETNGKMFVMSSLLGVLSFLMLFSLWYAYSLLRRNNRELTLAKEKAEQLAKSKAEFLATMSHEIRTPMNGVIGMANILSEENPRPDQKENLEILKFSADNLLNLINDILDLAKIESGNIELEKNEFNLEDHCRKNFLVYKNGKKKTNVELAIHTNLSGIKKQVIGDQIRLNQVLTNLVNNAMKFTEKGSVDVKIYATEINEKSAKVKFEIIDTGIGISKEKQKTIFEKYKQAETDTSRLYGGTGLGLNISKEIVELYGSELQLKSEVGKGSNFYFEIEFPLGSKDLNGKADPIRKEKNITELSGMKVLLAEDNKVNQLVANRILSNWGIELTIAQDGQEAIETVQENNFDLILMDIQMPRLDGYEATDIIRKMPSPKGNIPIVAMTASSLAVVEKSKIHKMNGYIGKPFNPEELLKTISEFKVSKTSPILN